jgi:hypothetical protein
MRGKTLSELRTAVRQRANMEVYSGEGFIGTTELDEYINQSAAELHELLAMSFEQYFVENLWVTLDGSTVRDNCRFVNEFIVLDDGTLGSGTPAEDAPPVFKILGVDKHDARDDTSFGNGTPLRRFSFADRTRADELMYQVTSANWGADDKPMSAPMIRIIPADACAGVYCVWYVPGYRVLEEETDALACPFAATNWQNYVVLDAAIKCLLKEETPVQELMMEKMALYKRIEAAARERDVSGPARIQVVDEEGPLVTRDRRLF